MRPNVIVLANLTEALRCLVRVGNTRVWRLRQWCALIVMMAVSAPSSSAAQQSPLLKDANELLNKAIGALREREFDEALTNFQRSAAMLRSIPAEPLTPADELQQGYVALQNEQLDRAEKVARRFVTDKALGDDARLLLANVHLQRRDYDEVLTLARDLLVATNARSAAAQLVVQVLERTRNWTYGLRWVQRLDPSIRSAPVARLLEAMMLDKANDLPRAQALLLALVHEDPGNASAVNLLYTSMLRFPGSAKAAEQFTKLVEKSPESPPLRQKLANLLYAEKQYTNALTHLLWLVAREPGDTELQYQLGQTSAKCKRWEPAAEAFRLVLESLQDNAKQSVSVRFELAKALVEQGSFEQALFELRQMESDLKATSDRPDPPGTHFYLGRAYHGMKDWKRAEEEFRRFHRMADYEDPETFRLLGEIYAERENWTEAVSAFETALKNAPNDPATLLRLGEAQLRAGLVQEALGSAERAKREARSPASLEVADRRRLVLLLARVQQALKPELALATLRDTQAQFAEDHEVGALFVETLLLAQREQEAMQYLEKLTRDGARGEAWDMLRARVYLRLGWDAEAEALYDQLTRKPAFAFDAFLGKAEVALKQARELKATRRDLPKALQLAHNAQQSLQEACTRRPTDMQAINQLASARELAGRIEENVRRDEGSGKSWRAVSWTSVGFMIPVVLFGTLYFREKGDVFRRASENIRQVESGLNALLEQLVRPYIVAKAINQLDRPITQQEGDDIWNNLLHEGLVKLDSGKAKFAKKRFDSDQTPHKSLLAFMDFGDLINLISNEPFSEYVSPHLGAGRAWPAVLADLRFLKDCRNVVYHLGKMKEDERARFFRTARPLSRRLEKILKNVRTAASKPPAAALEG
jgi:tetratricopeptide (TPR) repeat protein